MRIGMRGLKHACRAPGTGNRVSSPALPGTRIPAVRNERHDGRPMRTGVKDEGPRGHTAPGTERLSIRPATRQPSSLQGNRQGTNPGGGGSGSRRGGCPERNVGLDQAPVRPARASLPLGMRRNAGLEGELQGMTCIVTQLGQPSEGRQLRPQMPWRSAAQQESAVFGRRIGHAFKKQLDARDEGCLHFIEAGGERRDVEVDADRLPCIAIPIGVALKGEDQFGVRTRRSVDATVECDQCLRPPFHLPGTPIDDRRRRSF